MPTFEDTTITSSAPEEVWKALYDLARFPEWWHRAHGRVTLHGFRPRVRLAS
jgi:uncharacterized protein YndB with AHSA1/START domain